MYQPKQYLFCILSSLLFLASSCNKDDIEKNEQFNYAMTLAGQDRDNEMKLDESNFTIEKLDNQVADVLLTFTLPESLDSSIEVVNIQFSIDVDYGNILLNDNEINAENIAHAINEDISWETTNSSHIIFGSCNDESSCIGILQDFYKGDNFSLEASYDDDWLKVYGFIKKCKVISYYGDTYDIENLYFDYTVKVEI